MLMFCIMRWVGEDRRLTETPGRKYVVTGGDSAKTTRYCNQASIILPLGRNL